jgi:hypothetical protein
MASLYNIKFLLCLEIKHLLQIKNHPRTTKTKFLKVITTALSVVMCFCMDNFKREKHNKARLVQKPV